MVRYSLSEETAVNRYPFLLISAPVYYLFKHKDATSPVTMMKYDQINPKHKIGYLLK